MMTGSAFYDPAFVNGFLEWMGIAQRYEAATRQGSGFPNLDLILRGTFASLGMSDEPVTKSKPSLNETLRESIDKTKEAALWIWGTPLPFAILLLRWFWITLSDTPHYWSGLLEGHPIALPPSASWPHACRSWVFSCPT